MILQFDKDKGWPVLVVPLQGEKAGYVLGCPLDGPLHGQVVWIPREDLLAAPPAGTLPPRLDAYRSAKAESAAG